MTPLQSLIRTGTKLWLDSVDPDEIARNHRLGATGATSNPIIIADLLRSGRFDSLLAEQFLTKRTDEEIAWALTDRLVSDAEKTFLSIWQETKGDDGWVSFELDPLIEDSPLPQGERAKRYVELGKKWSVGHPNRIIKIPATPAGIAAAEELTAAGVPLNVTLIFSERQYRAARDACYRGALCLADRRSVKTVYSIFVSRVDVYTEKQAPTLSPDAQGLVGIVNAKRLWRENRQFWSDKGFPLRQEIVFASTGTKKPTDDPAKYVAAFAGSDIETNPPATNQAVEASGKSFVSRIDEMPPEELLREIDTKVDSAHMEETLMREGLAKFSEPQRALLALIASKRPR